MEKLIEIQNELKVPKGNINKFGNYKYRSAEDILEAVKPVLKKHNASCLLTDDIVLIGSKYFLKATATLSIDKNQIITNGFAELAEHKGMSAEQATGTASSYARKYALNGLFLIDETEADADADSQKPQEAKKEAPKGKQICGQKAFDQAIEKIKAGDKSIIAKVIESFELNENQLNILQDYK
jgi:hypothetical protein